MGRRRGPTLIERIHIVQRRGKACQLRMAGRTWQEIADELGYRHKGHACQDVQRALDELNAQERRREAEAREFRQAVARTLRPEWRALVHRLAAVDPLDLVFATTEGREVLRAMGALHRALAELDDLGLGDLDEVELAELGLA